MIKPVVAVLVSVLPHWRMSLLLGCLCAAVPVFPATAGDLMIYGDALASGWDNWSWDTAIGTNAKHKQGNSSAAVKYSAGWAGLSFRTGAPVATSAYKALHFWIYGSSGAGKLQVFTQTADDSGESSIYDFTPTPNAWKEVTIPLSDLGNPVQIARLNIMDGTGNVQPVYYLDDLRLVAKALPPLSLSVDAAANRQAISPYIYGINGHYDDGSITLLQSMSLPLRRWGGNNKSRYNWKIDATNTGMDWYYENVKLPDIAPPNPPSDSTVTRTVDENITSQAQTLLTVPMSGFVAKDAASCGFSIAKYGPQQDSDWQWRPDCGNGVKPDGSYITGNKAADTSLAVGPQFVKDWVAFLGKLYGKAGQGGVQFYNLDNEPDLWFDTHRDVFPVALKYDQLKARTIQYAAAIKAADSGAKILGPAVSGWSFYWHSPFDIQNEDYNWTDQNAHGGTPLTPWYLQQMRAYEKTKGKRILDYLDLHYYPQGFNSTYQGAGDAATQALRLRSTRSLWDPTYVDESWIGTSDKTDGGIVKLIPRMKAWVDAHYPGTKLAISEYLWGGLNDINGALAQADVLGIFGREGVHLAALWSPPGPDQPGAFAFRMYRNYNGKGAKFGVIGVRAASNDQSRLSIYAAEENSTGPLTVIVINKTGGPLSAPLILKNFTSTGVVQTWRYSPADLTRIVRLSDRSFTGNKFSGNFPANSITLLRLPGQRP